MSMQAGLLIAIRGGILLLLLMPLIVTPSTVFPFVVGKALYLRGIIEVVFTLWLILALRYPQYRPSRSVILSAFAIYMAVVLLAGLFGVSFQRSMWSNYERMQGIFDLAHWFALAVVLSAVFRSQFHWRLVFNGALVVSVLVGLLGLAQHYQIGLGFLDELTRLAQRYNIPIFFNTQPSDRLEITIGNPGYVGIYMLVNFLLALALLSHSFRTYTVLTGRRYRDLRREMRRELSWTWWWRTFWIFCAALDFWIIILSATRAALVGLVAGLLVIAVGYVLWGKRRDLRLAAGGLAAAVLVVTVALSLATEKGALKGLATSNPLIGKLSGITFSEAIGKRFTVARPGVEGFSVRPILGWGPENYTVVYHRYVRPQDVPWRIVDFDQAHNKVVEELTTKGLLGLISYLLLWGAIFWVIFRRVRQGEQDQLMALFIGGGLVGYFAANLFWFDTQVTMLVLVLLMGWVISLERDPGEAGLSAEGSHQVLGAATPAARSIEERGYIQASRPRAREEPAVEPFASFLWRKLRAAVWKLFPGAQRTSTQTEVFIALASTILLVLMVLSLYFLNYRAFRAGEGVKSLATRAESLDSLLAHSKEAIDTFPPLATFPRRLTLSNTGILWESLTREEKIGAQDLAIKEGERAIQSEPKNPKLYTDLAKIYQLAAQLDPAYVEVARGYVTEAQKFGPQHAWVHQLVANQKLLEGDFDGALQVVDDYMRINRPMENLLGGLKIRIQSAIDEAKKE